MLPVPATRSTLSGLIARRLIDCLLICFYEKPSDKQFVQLEELSPRLSSARVRERTLSQGPLTLISIRAIVTGMLNYPQNIETLVNDYQPSLYLDIILNFPEYRGGIRRNPT